jgi:hypothetical protein
MDASPSPTVTADSAKGGHNAAQELDANEIAVFVAEQFWLGRLL